MDWDRYKARCDAPDVCSRWLLVQTLQLVTDTSLKERLRQAMSVTPVEKPPDHRGTADTDMFPMALTLAEARAVRRCVADAAGGGATTSGTRGRGLGGFLQAWQEYEHYLERRQSGRRGKQVCSARS